MLWRWPTLVGCLLLLLPAVPVHALPELPRVLVDTTPVAPTGRTITVAAGGDFQAALNTAQFGDVIVLEAGASFTGSFTLPNKSGSGWITITGSRQASLPAQGTRVTPTDAANMPKIVTATPAPAIRTVAGAHHYRFRGIEFATTSSLNYGIVVFDGAPLDNSAAMTTLAEVPHHLIVEQCYIHGSPTGFVSRGVTTNSAHTAVIDSHIAEIHADFDAQTISGWNGPGPFKIVNNYLEASGENIMFGGAFASIPNLTASDIEIRRNHIAKRLAWQSDGSRWGIKNLLELKNAQRLLIDGNLFENHWASAQSGFAIVLTPRNEPHNGAWAMPWTTVSHVTFTNNVVRKVTAGIQIMGRENSDLLGYTGPRLSIPGVGFLIRNNLFDEIGTGTFNIPGSFAGKLFFITAGPTDVVIDHNTSSSLGSFLTGDDAAQTVSGFVYTNNLHPSTDYGIFASGKAPGASVLQAQFPGAVVVKNAFIGSDAMNLRASYPDNFYLASMAAAGLEDPATGRLTTTSPLKGRATDGKDVGVDPDALATARSSTSAPSPAPATTTASAPAASTTTASTSTPTTTTTPTSPSTSTTGGTSTSTSAGTTTSGSTGTTTTTSPTTTTTSPTTTTTATAPTSTPTTSTTAPATTVSSLSTSTTGTSGLSITSPQATGTVTGTITITTTTPSAASITRIDYILDGSLFAVTNPALFSLSWDSTRYPDGQHTLQAKAYDASGVVGESSVTFTTQNTRPSLDLRTTLLNQVVKVVAYAKGQFPLTSIKIYGDGGLLTTVPCTSSGCSGSYTWRAQRLPRGAHTVSGVVTDQRGITSSQTLQITIPSGR